MSRKSSFKVLHLSSEKTWRGGEQQIAYLIKELDSKGIQNYVLARKKSPFVDYCKKNNIPYFISSFSNDLDIRSAFTLRKVIKEVNPQLIHVHSARSHAIAYLACLLGIKTPIIVSKRTDFGIKSPKKYLHPNIKKILCVSDAITNIVKEDLHQGDNIHTVYSGIDLNKFSFQKDRIWFNKHYSCLPDDQIVINTSALAPQKDLLTFLKTAKIITDNNKNFKFFIFGEGQERELLERYIQQHQLENHVFLPGFVNNITQILPNADFFLMTSQTEGLGTSLLDSLACKIPIIATKAGGIPEVVQHEKTGLLCPIGDSQCLAQSLLKVEKDPKLRSELIENGLQHLQAYFTKEKTAEKTFVYYQEALENSTI